MPGIERKRPLPLVLLRTLDVGIADAMKDGNHPQVARPPEQHREEQTYSENTRKHGENRRWLREVIEV